MYEDSPRAHSNITLEKTKNPLRGFLFETIELEFLEL